MEIGDKVRFLNETGGGIITGFVDEHLVKVLTEDGFEFPVLKKEVIVVSTGPEDFNHTYNQKVRNEDTSANGDAEPENKNLTLADYLDEKKVKKSITRKRDKKENGRIGSEIEEVDLHIHNILPEIEDLGPGEILEAQMDRFTTALEGAVRNKQKKIVFIHGKGAGKLKYEIQKKLKTDYPGLRYQDASFKEYGYGATLVIIP
ncbi:MAG: Smr/MutS family protein [Bacteroidales bacterium]|nr:MAG: Smr/MutS family protein [Bacteroidales bacterium]